MKRFMPCFGLLVLMLVGAAGQAPAAPDSPYLKSRFSYKGQTVERSITPARPPSYRMPAVKLPTSNRSRGVVTLPDVPALNWCFGCAPTAAAMMFGYYDRTGYSNMYTGPANGGVFPLTNESWGDVVISGEARHQCPLSATRDSVDGRSGRGHVDDYWVLVGHAGPDPWIANAWTEHSLSDCTADYMGTSQSRWNNIDGSSTIFTNSSPGNEALHNYTGSETEDPAYLDLCHGMRDFAESRGYDVIANYNQRISNGFTGFTYGAFQYEIDQGRPVLIQVTGHTMLGIGYDTSTNKIYIHDTWDNKQHDMTWGGTYDGRQHWAVTVLQLAPRSAPNIMISLNGGAEDTGNLNAVIDLALLSSAVPNEVRFANEVGGMRGEWSDWEPWTATKSWTLAAGAAGMRAVYAQARNQFGESPEFRDQINYAGDVTPKKWTVLVYLDADNNLEPYGIQDLNEMESVGSSADVNIIVQMDRSPGFDTTNGDWTSCRRYYVTKDADTTSIGSTQVADLGEVNMGGPDTLQSFIHWGMANYPAQKYALIFWDHGGGWRTKLAATSKAGTKGPQPIRGDGSKAICWDDTNGGDCLYTKEWAGVIAGAPSSFDMVGFDVCLGGMLETAYELWATGKATAMAASPANEPGEGWPYDTFLAHLVGTPDMMGISLTDYAVIEYQHAYSGEDVTMSSYDLTKMPAALTGLNTFANAMITRNRDWLTVQFAKQASVAYDTNYTYWDIPLFAEAVRNTTTDQTIKDAAAAAVTALDNLVNHSYAGGGFAGGRGISASFPNNGVEAAYTGANLAWVVDSQWDEFLQAYANRDYSAPTAPVLDPVSNEDGNGSYDVTWSGATDNRGVTQYRVYETAGAENVMAQDDAETGAGSWALSGYTVTDTKGYSGTHSYYSGQGDYYTSTMTANVTVNAGYLTTISYWTWYDIEEGYDFVQLRISKNGGINWTTHAIYTGLACTWTQRRLDLSAYAGNTIQVQFRYLTDQSVAPIGFYVDDIRISSMTMNGTWDVNAASPALSLTQRPEGTPAYTVYAIDAAQNAGPLSNTEVATVLIGAPPSDPATVTVTPENPGVQDLHAEALGSTDPDNDEVSYEYEWSKIAKGGEWVVSPITDQTLSAGRLAGGDCWRARARAWDGRNYSDWVCSDNVTVTSMFLTTRPDHLDTNVPVDSSVYVTFRWPMKESSLGWRVKLRIGTVEVPSKILWVTKNRKLLLKPLEPLQADTEYRVRVSANAVCLDDRVLDWTEFFTFRTAPAASAAAVSVAAASTAAGAEVIVNLTSTGMVRTVITNLAGRTIAELPERSLPAGLTTLLWDGRSRSGARVPDGLYLVRVQARKDDGVQCAAITSLRMRR